MSVNVYPVIKTDVLCEDYTVKVNGCEINTNTARVSAVPFNRRWPGHQREISQSETVQFVSLECDEPLLFEVACHFEYDEKNVKIRPKSLGISPKVENGKISFTLPKPAYFTLEVTDRRRALHIFADRIKDYGINPTYEGVIYFGAGEHDAGLIELHSGQTLFIDEGAVVYACVRAEDAKNIKILGRGILDNSKNKEEILFSTNAVGNETAVQNAKRRHTVQLEYCDDVEIDGITMRDSLVYNIRPIGCRNLKIKNLKIIGCWRYNSDGIDMHNCRDVHISDCFIRTFDDSICVKGFDFYNEADVMAAIKAATYHGGCCYDSFENLVVERTVIFNDWGKSLEIGAETKAEKIRNIHFRNCDIIHLMGPALDCMNVDYAEVSEVYFTNINIEADEVIPKLLLQTKDGEEYHNTAPEYMPETISVTVEYHKEYSAGVNRRGKNHSFTFKNINLYGKHLPKLVFGGYDGEHKTENILIEDLYYNGVPMRSLDECDCHMGDFAENIRISVSPFSDMDKNTVSAIGQLKPDGCIRFENPNGGGARVMLVGNSITLHGIRPEIGWYHDFGMAASKKENDYAHILMRKICEKSPDSAFCICQVSEWESRYKEGQTILEKYEAARRFGADIIVMRVVENCPKDEYDSKIFREKYEGLINYLSSTGASVILTTGFWRHPADDDIIALGKEKNLPTVYLGDLGADDKMKACDLFAHSGVASHPGDLGMKNIAERIFEEIDKKLK